MPATLTAVHRQRQRALTFVVAAAMVALAACSQSGGRQVDVRAMLDASGRADQTETAVGAAPAADGTETSAPDGASATGEGATSGGRSGVGAPGGAASGSGSAASPGSRAGGPVGQGITDKTIKLGIEVTKPKDYAAFGGGGVSVNQVPPTKAVVAYINAHGGIAGRQIDAVFHEIDVTSGTFAQQSQAACTDLAEDNKVFLAVSITDGSPEPVCYAQHNVPYLDQRRFLAMDADTARFPNHYYPIGRLVTGEKWGKAFIDGLAAQHYFDGATKLGIFRYDNPTWQRMMNDTIRPALASHGVTIVEEQAGPQPGGVSELSGLAAPMSNAILRFQRSGVNRVIFIEAGGAVPFLFMPAAESQNFRPRYGLNSANALYFLQGNDPAAQLHDAVAVGWYPNDDTNGVFRLGTPAEKLCLDILHSAGMSDGQFVETMGYCDALFLAKRVLDGAGSLTVAGFRASLDQLGTSYQSPVTFSTRFASNRHMAANAARGLGFDDACACFKYNAFTIAMP